MGWSGLLLPGKCLIGGDIAVIGNNPQTLAP